jgi:subtilisin family serine protease
MRIPKVLYLLCSMVLLVSLLPVTAAAQPAAEIEQALLDQLAVGPANFFVKMAVDADLSAAYGMEWNARGQYVVDALKSVAAQTQGPVTAYAERNGLKYESYFINNSVEIFAGSVDAARDLAALPGVAYVRGEHFLSIPDPTVGAPGINGFVTAGAAPTATTDWGITDTKANQFWAAFGVKGDGIKVSSIDTGVQWNHPALINQFACPNAPSDPKCWADPSNICGGSACDNNGHGTHTMGTMAAKDDPSLTYIAGMAPNATWIACKGCESSSCSDTALIGCAQWLVQPGGSPANRPNVVNNSWGGGGGDTWYQTYVQSWVAAAIFPAFSAGNSGSSCSTLGSPGDYPESFASAAHDSSRNIASFSSRGPSLVPGQTYTKPNISAPGVSICSSVPTDGWSCGYSGTSMASPHTAGAVALLWSCNPSLKGQIDATFQILQNNADTPPAGNCGASPFGGNYTFGYGYLDILAAGYSACIGLEFGTLQGYVYDQGGSPIAGATVSASPGAEGAGIEATTDPNGFYTMQLVPGTYNATASKSGYSSQTVGGIVIVANQTTNQNFTLTYIGAWTQLPLGTGCPDWYRDDAEYYAPTGKAYLMGGRTDSATWVGTIYALDPATNTCTAVGTMPVAVSNYTNGLVNNGTADVLCTFGGNYSSTGYSNAVQCYNPVTNAVSTPTTLPGQLGNYIPGGAAVVNNKAYVFGGFRNTSTPYNISETWVWDPVANTWTQKGNQTMALGYEEVAVVDGKVYAFGGDIFDGVNLVAQTVAQVLDPATGNWTAIASLPSASGEGRGFGFDSASSYTLKGKIVLAGGGLWPSNTNAVVSYDVATSTYDTGFPALNAARRDFASFFVPGVALSSPGKMWVIGGWYGADAQPFAPPETFDVPMAPPPPQHFAHINKSKINGAPAARPGYFKVVFSARIHDELHTALPGATVLGTWTYPDNSTHDKTYVTDAMGRCKFPVKEPLAGTYTFCITDIQKTGYAYTPGANESPACLSKTLP